MKSEITYAELCQIIAEIGEYSYTADIENINLIEAGFESLKVMLISSELKRRGINVRVSELLKKPYLAEWWKIIKMQSVSAESKKEVDRSRTETMEFPLTDVQHAYWVGRNPDQVMGGISCYLYFEFECGEIDRQRLSKAWENVQYLHSSLRTKFLESGTQVIQDKPYNSSIIIYDLQQLDETEKKEKMEAVRNEYSHKVLAVERGEVAVLILSVIGKNKTILHFGIDLLVADLKSIKIIFSDLEKLYNDCSFEKTQSPFSLEEHMKHKENEDAYRKVAAYWKEHFATLPEAPELPLKRAYQSVKKPVFKRRNFMLEKADWDRLAASAAKNQVTPAMILLTIYTQILERYSNQSDFLMNIPLFNRPSEAEDKVADFTNILLLPVKGIEERGFISKTKRIQEAFLESLDYSAYSGVKVIRDILRSRPTQKLVAPIVFSCDCMEPIITDGFAGSFGKLKYISSQTPQVLIDFQVMRFPEGILLSWDTVEDVFPKGFIEDMFSAYIECLRWTISNPDKWGEELPVISETKFAERYSGINTIGVKQNLCLHELVFRNATDRSSKTAVIEGTGRTLTYYELCKEAKKLARLLQLEGVGPGDKVAVRLPRGAEQIISVLSILLLGACYVPIGMKQPDKRIEKIVKRADIRYMVSHGCHLRLNRVNIIDVNDRAKREEISANEPVNPSSSAYVIFTSGTTGEPKGVEISHFSAMNTICDVNKKCDISEKDSLLAVSSLEFDLSVYDIFGILGTGGTIVLLDEASKTDAAQWLDLVTRYHITCWNSVPFLLRMLLEQAQAEEMKLQSLKTVLLSGDWIGTDLPAKLADVAPNSELTALGGATEGSIWSNYYQVKLPVPKEWVSIPYGTPLDGQLYRVVDQRGRDCPDWVPGELWIGGIGVAKGYVGDETTTNNKFVSFKNIRWYKTGDMGRFWNDGTIEFLGRKDTQVKFRGYRIELGEIEAAINRAEGIKSSVACIVSEGGSQKLCAFIVKNDPDSELIQDETINQSISSYLPLYMVPSEYQYGKSIPLSANGKVDRKMVAELFFKERQAVAGYEKPQGAIEEELERLWIEVLGSTKYSRDISFFKAGGDSLKAIMLIDKIKKSHLVNGDLGTAILVNAPTIRELASQIQMINQGAELTIDTI